jgi:hypothetical protein
MFRHDGAFEAEATLGSGSDSVTELTAVSLIDLHQVALNLLAPI